ncbi:EamA family transporter [Pseudomonas sp. NPDC089395]|uniref:EamA family transporter n=1 Tax=Pseudomonas sp. NPDC089395 TaxID=3364460 RepID=UPI0037F383B2
MVCTTLLAWWSGESISLLQSVGLMICASGVAFVGLGCRASGSMSPVGDGRAILFALLAAVLYGVSFWLQGVYALPVIGPVSMLWVSYMVGVVVLWPVTYRILALRARGLRAYAALCGASLSNLGGFTAFSYGVASGSVAIVTVMSTLSGGVAALVGYLFYRERLTALQFLGICLVLSGAVTLHLVGGS